MGLDTNELPASSTSLVGRIEAFSCGSILMLSRQSIEGEGFEEPPRESRGFSLVIGSRGALGEHPARLLVDDANAKDC